MQTKLDSIKVLADTFASLNRHIRIQFQQNFIWNHPVRPNEICLNRFYANLKSSPSSEIVEERGSRKRFES